LNRNTIETIKHQNKESYENNINDFGIGTNGIVCRECRECFLSGEDSDRKHGSIKNNQFIIGEIGNCKKSTSQESQKWCSLKEIKVSE
jgi:hypothetical protein